MGIRKLAGSGGGSSVVVAGFSWDVVSMCVLGCVCLLMSVSGVLTAGGKFDSNVVILAIELHCLIVSLSLLVVVVAVVVVCTSTVFSSNHAL